MSRQTCGLAILDLDGTLFRTETATVPAIRQAFQELQVPPPDEKVILAFFGRPTGEYHAWLRAQCPPQHADAVVSRVDELELVYATVQGELYPGVQQALKELKEMGVQMALCSNGPPPYVEHILAAHGLARFFHRVRCWQSTADNKLAMIGELLGELQPRRAVVVGDRSDDIAAAHHYGAAAVGIKYGYGSAQEIRLAEVQAASAGELPGLIWTLLAQARPGSYSF